MENSEQPEWLDEAIRRIFADGSWRDGRRSMFAHPVVRGALESKWQANEPRLNEIHAMTGLGREMHGAEIERLEAEQDRIEFELGRDGRPASTRWSGAP